MACITGFTSGGYYQYTGCCGDIQSGFANQIIDVCIDSAYSASTIGIIYDTTSTCSVDCSQGPLGYSFSLSGICDSATGTVTITSFGGIPPYTIDPITPTGSVLMFSD